MRVHNRFLIKNYPFITPIDINGRRIENPDFSSTLLDDIPEGWKVGFGYFFCEDLKDLLVKLDLLDSFQILQIKEKFGKLCVYTNTDNKHIQSLIDSYSERSLHCCVDCASQDAKPIKAPHVVPLCKRCFHRRYPDMEYTVFDAYKKEFETQISSKERLIKLDDDLGLILNCAVRYAMGRMTYVPGAVTSYIEPLLPSLDNRTISCLVRDLEFHQEDVEKGVAIWGMECDRLDWLHFYELCKKEKARRNLQ